MKLIEKFNERNKTHLCVGPMSKNCVDATIELAYEYNVNLMLIASRRQIECAELGGGYVNNWDTISFSNYVKNNDPDKKITIARDHGGPWQHPLEWKKCITIDQAMESAKKSFSIDIEAGFEVIHIDPVLNNNEDPTLDWVLEKVFELYSYCINEAKRLKKEILIEIGTEEQGISPISDLNILEDQLKKISQFCNKNNYAKPAFIVVQTGTKVMGMKNIGDFPNKNEEIKEYREKHKFSKIIDICNKYGIKIKEHNADYLSDNSLIIHPEIGIHAVNVAPEFGVTETIALLTIMDKLSAVNEKNEFIKICIESNKWVKWVIGLGEVSDLDKTKICGHYMFSDNRILKLKEIIGSAYLEKFGKELDIYLKDEVKKSIYRYMINFKMVTKG